MECQLLAAAASAEHQRSGIVLKKRYRGLAPHIDSRVRGTPHTPLSAAAVRGTCADHAYAVKGGCSTKTYPVVGDISICQYSNKS